MNQLLTNSGKPIINRKTGTPIYNRSVEFRIKQIKQLLGLNTGKQTPDERWASIIQETKRRSSLLLN